jgi:hypothetical protein
VATCHLQLWRIVPATPLNLAEGVREDQRARFGLFNFDAEEAARDRAHGLPRVGVVVGGRQVGRLECRRESDRAQAPTDTRERGEIDAARPRPFAEESRKVGSERAGRNEALRYE